MAVASKSLTTLRLDLTGSFMEFELESEAAGFIGMRAMPVMEVPVQAGVFGKVEAGELLKNADLRRAPGSGYNRDTMTFTDDVFSTKEYGAEEVVDEREANMYEDYFDSEVLAAARARSKLLREQEKRIAALLQDDAVIGTSAAANTWDSATGTPIGDVETAIQAIYAATGMWPNLMLIDRQCFRLLRNNDEIVELVKYGGFMDPATGNVTVRSLEQVLDINIAVAGVSKNTAAEGAAASIASVWDKTKATILRAPTSMDIREPCYGRSFHWGRDGSSIGGTAEEYEDPSSRADVKRVRHDVEEKVLFNEAAHVITSVIA